MRRVLEASENAIIESNSILRFLQPDVCAMVLDGGVADFKPTSLRFLDRANVLVVTGCADLAWPQVSASLLRNKPRFAAPPPEYENPDFIAALKSFSPSASDVEDDGHGSQDNFELILSLDSSSRWIV